LPRYGNGTGGDVKFYKADLTRAKHNTPLVEERFVVCDTCGRKDHEVCVMYNAYLGAPYRCRRCAGSDTHGCTMDTVAALPLSDVAALIQQEVNEVEGYGETVVVRTINHSREVCETKPKLRQRFPDAETKFPYTRKVILAFTPIDGRPVCFFGCIVHEYGVDCQDPNHLVSVRQRCSSGSMWVLFGVCRGEGPRGEGCYCLASLADAEYPGWPSPLIL